MQDKTTDPASGIVEAIARLQSAFFNAGLMEPVAIVLAGEEQVLGLARAFSRFLYQPSPDPERPWEGLKIRGIKVICNAQG